MKKKYKFSLKNKRVWVAGHTGMVGSAILKRLKRENCYVLTVDQSKLDLTDQNKTRDWIKKNKPEVVFIAAARVGGILANSNNHSDFLYDNLMIQNNVIKLSSENNVKKLIFLGSSCIYPKVSEQPINEKQLMQGPLEETNEGYALAKIAGLKLCSYLNIEKNKDFISLMPTNLYGPGDNYNLQTSHVMGALINKIVYAKINNKNEIEIWGRGIARREFLHVEDVADAACFLAKNYSSSEPINIGTSKDISILELAETISKILKWEGSFKLNKKMPDGMLLKRLDIRKIKKLGWKPKISLEKGLKRTIKEYMSKIKS